MELIKVHGEDSDSEKGILWRKLRRLLISLIVILNYIDLLHSSRVNFTFL